MVRPGFGFSHHVGVKRETLQVQLHLPGNGLTGLKQVLVLDAIKHDGWLFLLSNQIQIAFFLIWFW